MTKGLRRFFVFLTTLYNNIIRCKGKKNGEIPRLWYMKCYSCGIGRNEKKVVPLHRENKDKVLTIKKIEDYEQQETSF